MEPMQQIIEVTIANATEATKDLVGGKIKSISTFL